MKWVIEETSNSCVCSYLKATLTGRGCRDVLTMAARCAYKTKQKICIKSCTF